MLERMKRGFWDGAARQAAGEPEGIERAVRHRDRVLRLAARHATLDILCVTLYDTFSLR